MIYLIGFIILAAVVLVANQMGFFKSKATVCTCDKCDDANCKCEENKCGDNCKCHDTIAVETPSPYMNGHSVKVTAVVEETPVVEAPPAPPAPEEPKKEEPKAPKKPTIKKVSPPKKADPKKKKKK